ncbi:MAG: tetratricopeptide repeat protein [Longimicrobiales bacterium]|nr:tetratricopeptide repeat protein [Longimicrobiales bacterium]
MSNKQRQARQVVAEGVTAWERDDFASALDTFQGVLKDFPHFADVQNKVGLCLAMLGRLEEALGHFDHALEYNSSYAEAHLNRGIVLKDLGRHDEAQDAFDRAGELDTRDSPEFPSEVGNRLAVTHAQLGDLYLVANHPLEAVEHYRDALAIRPRFMDIRSKFAETLIELGELGQAKEELELILESRPYFVGARVRLGVVFHRLGEDGDAVTHWRRCLEDDPRDMRARAYLASVGMSPDPDPDRGTGTVEG